ncbi:MAG: NAD-dependent epimerase/dehydratase family protein, partial [bacterium]|nr:NAD-dependent epimerase/dehydratase family protein [bacterium]
DIDRACEDADTVYHLAAAVGVKHVFDNPLRTLKTNIRGTENVFDAAMRTGNRLVNILALAAAFALSNAAAEPIIEVRQPMTPPEWALLEREVLRAGSEAVDLFYDKYFDERGYLLHVARWGILDGTDDAIETFHNWTLFHSLGADDLVLDRYRKGLEGHLRQYTAVTTKTTDIAKDGVYHREFYGHSDWLHTGEGLRGFFFQGLTDPADGRYIERMRRFAGL